MALVSAPGTRLSTELLSSLINISSLNTTARRELSPISDYLSSRPIMQWVRLPIRPDPKKITSLHWILKANEINPNILLPGGFPVIGFIESPEDNNTLPLNIAYQTTNLVFLEPYIKNDRLYLHTSRLKEYFQDSVIDGDIHKVDAILSQHSITSEEGRHIFCVGDWVQLYHNYTWLLTAQITGLRDADITLDRPCPDNVTGLLLVNDEQDPPMEFKVPSITIQLFGFSKGLHPQKQKWFQYNLLEISVGMDRCMLVVVPPEQLKDAQRGDAIYLHCEKEQHTNELLLTYNTEEKGTCIGTAILVWPSTEDYSILALLLGNHTTLDINLSALL